MKASMDAITKTIRAGYDEVEYPALSYPQAHPNRMATAAALAGLSPVPLEKCRVLEVGCATGGNLLPMSEQMPGSRFLGIDLSPEQIAHGQPIARNLGLINTELRCQDLMQFPRCEGEFDYIIAHGFYSWVPAEVRNHLLKICQRHLSRDGLAFISYGAMPGCHGMLAARALIHFHTRRIQDDRERVSKGLEILDFVRGQAPIADDYPIVLERARKLLSEISWQHARHDILAPVNEPLYFGQFMSGADRFGLAYAGDSDAFDLLARIPESARNYIQRLQATELEREQYLDFLINRRFRASVLCRAEAMQRAQPQRDQVREELWVSGFYAEKPETGDASGKRYEVSIAGSRVLLDEGPILSAFRYVRNAWPGSVRFTEMVKAALNDSSKPSVEVESALFGFIKMCYGMGIIELSISPRNRIARSISRMPEITRFAQWQAGKGVPIVNLRHVGVNFPDPHRALMPLIDGSREVQSLAAELEGLRMRNFPVHSSEAKPDLERARPVVETILRDLWEHSFLLNN